MLKEPNKIRLARPEDRSDLLDFFRLVSDQFAPPLTARTDIEAWTDKLLDRAHGYVIEGSSGLLGCAFGYCNNLDTKIGQLSVIAIAPQAQGKGQGTILFAALLRKCWEMGMHEAQGRYDSKKAWQIRFYKERFGAREFSSDCKDTYPGAIFLTIDLAAIYGNQRQTFPT